MGGGPSTLWAPPLLWSAPVTSCGCRPGGPHAADCRMGGHWPRGRGNLSFEHFSEEAEGPVGPAILSALLGPGTLGESLAASARLI